MCEPAARVASQEEGCHLILAEMIDDEGSTFSVDGLHRCRAVVAG